jgi:hypothetical protein
MRLAASVIIGALTLAGTGCQMSYNEMSHVPDPPGIPESYTRSPNSEGVGYLSKSTRAELTALKAECAQARQEQYYIFWGTYTQTLQTRLDQFDDRARAEALVSFRALTGNLTPELMGLTERDVDVTRNMAVITNQNERMIWGDLGRAFLWDRPSRLSPYDIISTSGQPSQ